MEGLFAKTLWCSGHDYHSSWGNDTANGCQGCWWFVYLVVSHLWLLTCFLLVQLVILRKYNGFTLMYCRSEVQLQQPRQESLAGADQATAVKFIQSHHAYRPEFHLSTSCIPSNWFQSSASKSYRRQESHGIAIFGILVFYFRKANATDVEVCSLLEQKLRWIISRPFWYAAHIRLSCLA